MNKIAKVIVVIILGYLVYYVFAVMYYTHSFSWDTCKQYMWFFKDPIVNNIDPPHFSVCSSYVKKRDIHNVFHYVKDNDMYPIIIWEFKDLTNINMNKVIVNRNIDLEKIKFKSAEILHSESSVPITINYGFIFHNELNINLDKYSKIVGTFEGPNYKGFYGTIDKMSFNDENGKPQILFDYSPKPYKASFSPTVFLLYKGHKSFYVIIFNSEKPFKDASIINILNLQ